MPDTTLLTGQDIAEAEGALTSLLERALVPSGRSRAEFVTMRVLAARGPFAAAQDLGDYLVGERQLGLDHAGVVALLDRLQADHLVTTPPVELTFDGRALLDELRTTVAPVTREVFAGLDDGDLAAAHRVMIELVRRARTMTAGRSS